MSTVYVTFRVTVKNHEYNYNATRSGEADFDFKASRDVLDSLDPTSFLKAMFGSALAKYDACKEEEEEEQA